MRDNERKIMNFLVNKILDDGSVSYGLTGSGYVVLIIVCVLLMTIGCFARDNNSKLNVKHIAFAAMAMALAVATSMIKVIKLPMGGSVTLFSMLFIVLIGYWYGIKTGLTAALAYGVLQLLLDPYILNIPQVLLDYILGFGALGLSGVFSKSKHGLVKGYIIGVIGRFICSFLSGWIFFAVYTPEFFNIAEKLYPYMDKDDFDTSLYVLSNKDRTFGVSLLLYDNTDILKDCLNKVKD